MGTNAFAFNWGDGTTLLMRSRCVFRIECIDLPSLTTLTTEGDDSYTFRHAHQVILDSDCDLTAVMRRYAKPHYGCANRECLYEQDEKKGSSRVILALLQIIRICNKNCLLRASVGVVLA